ncbi:signal recognition particle protein [Mycoplasmatota bacterium]|nr:signal recognition particle protein [Mycoplasmatota bacterium]
MAFNSLSERLQMSLRRVTGRGRLTEKDIEDMMKEIRLSLLEADVNYKVVKEFTKEIKEKSMDTTILTGLNPGQQVVKIVHEELKTLMGEDSPLIFNSGMSVFMLVGLQGAGKTTHVGKLANYLRKKEGKNPLLVACDIYRPAAINQLKTIGNQLEIPVFEMGQEKPKKIVKEALKFAKENNHDLVIIDTAGRLHIDENMMDELVEIKKLTSPDEILLTVDAMTGQDAVNVADTFNKTLNVTGCILTKLDGDTRGGAALSIRKVTNVPIKFSGTGEKLDELEVFHGERMASRILGMGDVLSLVEKVTESIDEDEAMNMMDKMMSNKFNYNDMLSQFKMMKKMGSMSKILGMVPGAGNIKNLINNVDDSKFKKMEIIIGSMTKEEKRNPDLIDKSSRRRNRIAKGAGTTVAEVNKLRRALETQKDMAKRMSGLNPNSMNLGNMQNLMSSGAKPKKSRGKGRNKRRW